MGLPTTYITKGDAGVAARLEALVRERYCEPLYERVADAIPEAVEVLLNLGPDGSLWVADAPRHTALTQTLYDEFKDAGRFEFKEKDALVAPYDILRFRVNGAAQCELFDRHLWELPEMMAGFFPITDPQSGTRIILDEVHAESIPNPYTSAYCIDASFRLVDDSGELDQLENYGFGRFWSPGDNGRGKEGAGIPLGRPYDEVARGVHRFVRSWCSRELPERLARCVKAGKRTLKSILGDED